MANSKQQAVEAAARVTATDALKRSGLLDFNMQAALLQHPAVTQNQQVVLALLQACKQLQVAVTERCSGQVPAVLRAQNLQQVLIFAQHWLPKHGSLLGQLEVQLGDSSSCSWWWHTDKWRSAAVEALALALEQQQHLQAFCLRGAPAGPMFQHLPGICLTRLCVNVDFSVKFRLCTNVDFTASFAALARLTGLRSLDLCNSNAALGGVP